MAVRLDRETGDLVVDGFEQGIQPSPHKGIANIQNANISTETGEVINSFARVQDTMTDTTATGTIAFVDTSHVALSIANTNNLFKGNWITVTGSSNTSQLPNGTYYVPPSSGANFQLQNYYSSLATPSQTATASYLLVGGGGNGGGASGSGAAGGGGGGAGQVKSGTTSLSPGSFPITVAAAASSSTAFSQTAVAGSNGISSSGTTTGAGGASGSGNAGGTGGTTGTGGGGGGGDSVVGSNAGNVGLGGNGGTGTANSITGTSVTYAGGGGGAAVSGHAGGTGGTGGGGAGWSNGPILPTAGTANTGGGGGGNNVGSGANGGTGVVIISYPTASIFGATGGTITSYTDGGGVSHNVHTFTSSGTFVVPPVSATQPLTGFTTGLTASFTMVAIMGKPIAKATETYLSNGTVYNRYYLLDNQNLVWVYDTQNETTYVPTDNVSWFLPDFSTTWCTSASGIAVISGWLIGTASNGAFAKPVVELGNTNSTATTWVQMPDVTTWAGVAGSTTIPHFAYTGHQGNVYVTDGAYIANIEPLSTIADSTGASTAQNVQTLCSVTPIAIFDEATYSVISGTTALPSDNKRVPVVFFTTNGGTLPTAITPATVYYLDVNTTVIEAFSASTGGSALDLFSGQQGPLYFSTFYPVSSNTDSTSATPTYVFENQRLSLPVFEISQCLAEVGNTIVIGCKSNILYPWDQVQNLPENIIPLPESNTVSITTVNQMGYVLTGNKGNIYLTDGNVASSVTTVPDYVAGIAGTPNSYIEPVFQWGDSMYLRGRVYFSILDQTSTKAGNCGGIWSFVPTQNLYIGQDVGIALRLENQSSYGTYNGYASVLIPKINQQAIAPQYFSGWENSITSPSYGIDATSTGSSTTSVAVMETDAIPTGTMLDKRSFEQIEFKVATPLLVGDSVTLSYRKSLTDAWKSAGTVQLQNDRLSGYVSAVFEKSQWLQIQMTLKPVSATSFIRVTELRIR